MKTSMFLLCCLFLLNGCTYYEVKNYKAMTVGMITDYDKHYRSYAFAPNCKYKVNNVEYRCGYGKYINLSYWESYKGKYFPVLYSTRKPNYSIMLIVPEDFERWGMEFPDSLNWVKEKMDW